MKSQLNTISIDLLDQYLLKINKGLPSLFYKLEDTETHSANFNFHTAVASIFSCKITGEKIELDSYIQHKKSGGESLRDDTKKADDLYNAYTFAKSNSLNKKNVEKAHRLLSKHILEEHQQGKNRIRNPFTAIPDEKNKHATTVTIEVGSEMQRFYEDLDSLITSTLTIEEAFFFASMLHLVFVKIHPFNDGNGRTARLLEKWFLSQKLGKKAWLVESEKYYYKHHEAYLNDLKVLGSEYIKLDYLKALPFLLMLPNSISEKG